MKTYKLKKWNILTQDGKSEFDQYCSENPWGFFLEVDRYGTYQVLPHPHMNEVFRIKSWAFVQINKDK